MESSPQPRTQKTLAAWAVCILLLLAVAAAFGRAVRYDFVNYDDGDYVAQNAMVLKGLTAPGVVWAFTNSQVQMWIPTTWLSLMLDAQCYGDNAWGYHLTNILLHAATAIGLFLVFWRMTGRLWPTLLRRPCSPSIRCGSNRWRGSPNARTC